MALEEIIGKNVAYMLDENKDIARYVSHKDRLKLKDTLYEKLAQEYKDRNYLITGAKWLDRMKQIASAVKLPIDLVLGHVPILGDIIAYPIRGIVNVVEMAFELPAIGYYIWDSGGKDLQTPGYGLARAALTYAPSVPGTIGDALGFIPIYKRGIEGYLRKNVADDFRKQYMQSVDTEDVVDLEIERRKREKDLERKIQRGKEAA
jgi:hypothetical protein